MPKKAHTPTDLIQLAERLEVIALKLLDAGDTRMRTSGNQTLAMALRYRQAAHKLCPHCQRSGAIDTNQVGTWGPPE